MGALATRDPAALASIQPTCLPFHHEGYIRLCNKMVTSGGGWEGPSGGGWGAPSRVSQNVLQQILESSVHNSVSLPQVTLSPHL